MYEKVNPAHPDKIADRIAGALVDLAYAQEKDPRIAVEVLIGHGKCHIIAETSVRLADDDVRAAVERIAGPGYEVDYDEHAQDAHLAANQVEGIRCGDNGVFRGMPITPEQRAFTAEASRWYEAALRTDGKYLCDSRRAVMCQSNVTEAEAAWLASGAETIWPTVIVNPLGEWTGGPDVDAGATNRKLGSDMGDAVTGGGLHGKDLSKADVAVNIYCHLEAQKTGWPVEITCAIGDDEVDGRPYAEIVEIARAYIRGAGGFERFAEWGLIRP